MAAQAQTEAAQAKSLAQANEQEAAATKATLSQVQGQLAQEVAQAAIQEAQQEAAAAAAAASQRAAASRRPRRPQAAATVAGAVGGSASGAAATDAANQAPAVVGPVGGSSTGGSGGMAAVQAAVSAARRARTCSAGSSPASASTARVWCNGPGRRPACPSPGRPRRSGRPCPTCRSTRSQPGDLLFYYNLDGDNQVDHVVMYTGSGPYGTDTVIQAPFTGSTVSYSPIFTEGLIGAARP